MPLALMAIEVDAFCRIGTTPLEIRKLPDNHHALQCRRLRSPPRRQPLTPQHHGLPQRGVLSMRTMRVCWTGRDDLHAAIRAAPLRVGGRLSGGVIVLVLAILGIVPCRPANAEQFTMVCSLHYEDGKSDQTTVDIDTSIPSIDGNKDGEVEDLGGPCTHKVSVTTSSFSWARDCRTADGGRSRLDSFTIDRLTGYYSEISSLGGDSHIYRGYGSCEKRRSMKPPLFEH
jgi:hypothetical protein